MLLTEIEAAKQIRDGRLPSPYKFSNMWLVNLRITGTGMAYRAAEKEFVWRSPKTYLNPQFLERCSGVPVIIDHPEGKTLEDVGERSRIIGTVMLPYIRGDEVWGVCRIYGQEIIDYIQKARGVVSTSPSVVFCGGSGGADFPDVMGEDNFFIEGTPFLIDHVALVPLGVWDKDGKPSGVEVTTPTEEEQLAGMVREVIDAACKPALEKLEAISGRLDQLEKQSE
ncbi:cell envelope integrity/translocation protein TolA [Citrobacter sp. S-77]|uniref:cell envelope integrity/translocation protein TolA n=1 Tax=Citrobacter sp. S-77 TaxID=1080067 RepID=UPI0005EDCF30|nr:cell envelope integrity/translocation protein TolA [Citrobacter sp. S-77]